MEINKNFKGHSVIYPASYEKAKDLTKTQLEDVVFEREYNVYTDNEIEARYLVTPKFIETLLKAKEILGCCEIACSFYNKSLLIGAIYKTSAPIDKIGLFEITNFNSKKITSQNFIDVYKDLTKVFKTVKYFQEIA